MLYGFLGAIPNGWGIWLVEFTQLGKSTHALSVCPWARKWEGRVIGFWQVI
jgi:hypothetical protein